MNITHAKSEEVVGDRLVAIFNRQKELMSKYHDIEKRSGLMETEDCPVNLDDKRGQARIKNFSWRIIEEVGEALDAFRMNDIPHFKEELIDGLHFLTEMSILSDLDLTRFSDGTDKDTLKILCDSNSHCVDTLDKQVSSLVENLGMMCNCLKNKPWKQTNMLTDKNNFYDRLIKVWNIYISILLTIMNDEEITDIYLRKSQVNKFRQRSNY